MPEDDPAGSGTPPGPAEQDELAALRASEKRLEAAQALAHMGSYDWDMTTDVNEWSDELYRIYGAEPQSFNASYERFLSFVHPDDREHVQAVHKRALETCEPYTMEERIVRADGSMRTLLTTGEVLTDPAGVPVRFRGICWDITDRKRAEEAAANAAMRLHDAENRRWQAFEINDNVLQGLATTLYALEAGTVDVAKEAARRTLGSARQMISGLLGDVAGGGLRPGDLIRDRPAARVLSAAPEQRLRVAASETPRRALRVLVVDDAEDIRDILRINLRQSGAEVVAEAGDGAEAVRLAAEHKPDAVLLDIAMPGMDGLEALPLVRRVAPNAKVVVLSGFDAARMEETALSLGAAAYVEKGTAMTRIAELLAELCADVGWQPNVPEPIPAPEPEPGADSVTHLVHELRTPLTVVVGILDTIRQHGERMPSVTAQELWAALARNVDHLTALLDVTLDAHYLGRNELGLQRDAVDVASLVRQATADLAVVTGPRVVTVNTTGPVVAEVDAIRVRQVVTNLVSNAVKYSSPGMPIEITVEADETMAHISVADSGPGIPAERRGELFERFGRLDERMPGMGLGLYVSRGIADAHGGTLDIVDDGLPGATFRLSVPVRATSALPF